MITSDPTHPGVNSPGSDGQNKAYLVLSEEERAKGFVRPVRRSYVHTGEKPANPLRDLTHEEQTRLAGLQYVKYEAYPPNGSATVGRFWTEKQLKGGCGQVTTMPLAIAETYARDPKFYGSTFCCGCKCHLPVAEFTWDKTTEAVGS